jgi:hypothetical protein
MKTYTVRLAETDPYRGTFRTFDGIPGRFTVEPRAVELTDDQAKALLGWGLVVETDAPPPDEMAGKSKGRV